MTKHLLNAIGEGAYDRGRAQKGVVLIIVLAVLMILALMGTVFVTFQTLEKRIALNQTDDVRAKMLAQSGLDAAAEELSRAFGANGGMEYTLTGGVSIANAGGTWMYYGDQDNETLPPNSTLNIDLATNPSLAVESDDDPTNGPANAAPKPIIINSNTRGISGSLDTNTYGTNGDVYVLKIADESGAINVNDGIRWGVTHSVSKNLERVLNALGNSLTPVIANVGTDILTNRPVNGYSTKTELLTLAFSGNQTTYDAVKDLVSTDSWSDSNVANLVPLSATMLSQYPAGITYVRPSYNGAARYRHGHQRNYKGVAAPSTWNLRFYTSGIAHFDHAIYEFDSLNPNWIEVVERSPVNINSAPKEVLQALLTDLQGFFTVERRRFRPVTYGGNTVSNYRMIGQVYTYDRGGQLIGKFPNPSEHHSRWRRR